MSLEIEVIIEDRRWLDDLDPEQLVARFVDQIGHHKKISVPNNVEASVLFCSDNRIQELNQKWMQKNAPTNVLSFPAAEFQKFCDQKYLGDIAISFETVVSEARNEGKSVYQHAAHMLVHGFLHLLGFDHQSEDQAALMEGHESEILIGIGIEDPWAQCNVKDFADD
jgi:probable rRNA maturation factor